MPAEFDRMLAGYVRRTNNARVYFRELYALHFNVNRGEKTPAIDGKDVILLPGEKPNRDARPVKLKERTADEIAELTRRFNQS